MRIVRLTIAVLIFIAAFCITRSAYAVSWSYDLDNAMKAAKSRQTPVMADFYTVWCGWCTKLDKDTYTDRRVNELSKEFVCVKVDCEKDRQVASRYNVRGYPTIIFFDSSGNEKKRITGYVNAADLAKVMTGFAKRAPDGSPAVSLMERVKKIIKPEFELTGILGGAGAPKAIINDNIVGIGDSVKGAKVVDIKKKTVKLLLKDREIVLKLP